MSSPVEQIKQRLTVEDVVGSCIKLQKAGANYRACCPFHSEKTPSFYVSPTREIWHCFGCNRGGDIFEFIKQIEGVEFPEALRLLADRAGVTLTRQNLEFRNERIRLLDLTKEATFFYQKKLAENKDALSYLWKRGLKNETLKDFNIGFAPPEADGWRFLFNYLKGRGYSAVEMEKVGLAVKKENDYYDRFRGRIMFPLKDASGRVVGFSGRIFNVKEVEPPLGGSISAKYINTPQTILYDKSRILYGFDRAKTEIRKKDKCVLVEGQMDVLMSHQAGVQNTVAVSGTALTLQHLDVIRRLTNNLSMAFDNDEAGLQAAKRSIALGLENGFEVRVVSLFAGKDPADAILENSENWIEAVEKDEHIIDFYLKFLKDRHKEDERRFKLEVEKSVLPYIFSIQSEIERSHWIKKIAKQLDVKEAAILEGLKRIKIPASRSGGNSDKKNILKRSQLLKEKLAGIVFWKSLDKIRDKSLVPDIVKKFISEIARNIKKEEKEKLAFEAELYYSGSQDIEKEITHLAKELKKEIVKEGLESLSEEVQKLEAGGETEKLGQKMAEFQNLSKQLYDC
ncbi:DNA primase [Patescibacteria group bacterium]|nr:DNA primase [Patescibacteria group bacterium]